MIACEPLKTQVLSERNVWEKLNLLPAQLHALMRGEVFSIPEMPGRDVQILPIRELPAKPGLSTREGQARLLHDLASIELQAMELALRTLLEFPEAPMAMREELCQITLEEGSHLKLCLEGLEALGSPWGTFAAHNGLWQCVSSEDSLLDRLVIVHRYLEGSGLDASHTLLRRLGGVKASEVLRAVSVISRDEMAHVQFGSRWYHSLVVGDAADDFKTRINRLFDRIPRRLEPIHVDLRRESGFSEDEIEILQGVRSKLMNTNRATHVVTNF